MEFLRSRALQVAGIILMLCGFFYEATYVSIPYQDATPEMIADYQHHSKIASLQTRGGLAIGVLGTLLRMILKKRNRME
jgi:Na+/melibiose symporter-like transporter